MFKSIKTIPLDDEIKLDSNKEDNFKVDKNKASQEVKSNETEVQLINKPRLFSCYNHIF